MVSLFFLNKYNNFWYTKNNDWPNFKNYFRFFVYILNDWPPFLFGWLKGEGISKFRSCFFLYYFGGSKKFGSFILHWVSFLELLFFISFDKHLFKEKNLVFHATNYLLPVCVFLGFLDVFVLWMEPTGCLVFVWMKPKKFLNLAFSV